MSESLLEIRHPDLRRLFTIWSLISADSAYAYLHAGMFEEFKEHLLILELHGHNRSIRELHVGLAIRDLEEDATITVAIDAVAGSHQPLMLEWTNSEDKRLVGLILPFRQHHSGGLQIVAAIYLARPASPNTQSE